MYVFQVHYLGCLRYVLYKFMQLKTHKQLAQNINNRTEIRRSRVFRYYEHNNKSYGTGCFV